MNVTEAIRARRSIRKYKDAEIPREHIQMILEAAMMCPSARNMRPYQFAVVASREKRREIAEISPNFRMIASAPLAIVVCGRLDIAEGLGHDFWIQDCSAATQNILLQALELGYGTCWCGTYPVAERVDKVKKVLGTESAGVVPFSVIAVGVADECPEARGFYDKDRVTFY